MLRSSTFIRERTGGKNAGYYRLRVLPKDAEVLTQSQSKRRTYWLVHDWAKFGVCTGNSIHILLEAKCRKEKQGTSQITFTLTH